MMTWKSSGKSGKVFCQRSSSGSGAQIKGVGPKVSSNFMILQVSELKYIKLTSRGTFQGRNLIFHQFFPL